MPSSSARNWFVRQDGKVTGPLSEAELRQDLPLLLGTDTEIRQGNSQWYPASVVKAKFDALEEQGVYLRRRGSKIEGPFTATRAIEMLRDDPSGEVMVGKHGSWELASIFLDQAKAKTSAMPKISVKCSHCHKNLVMPASLVGTLATCPNCSDTFRVSDPADSPTSAPNPITPTTPVELATPVESKTPAEPKTRAEPKMPGKAPIVVPASEIEVIRDSPVSAPQYSAVRNTPAATVPVAPAIDPFDFEAPPPLPGNRPRAPLANPGAGVYLSGNHASPSTAGATGGGDRSIHYVIPGALILPWGVLYLIAAISYVIQLGALVAFASGLIGTPEMAQSASGQQLAITGLIHIVSLLYCVALAYVFIGGSFAMFQRRSHQLPLARAAAVAAAIPCFGCPVMPFGIWACASLFSDHAPRDFRR